MNKNKIKKIAGYCRLSRDEDKENFISIEEQKRIIKDYAKLDNLLIVVFLIPYVMPIPKESMLTDTASINIAKNKCLTSKYNM